MRRLRHLIHRPIEGDFVGLGRPAKAAELANKLHRRRPNLFVRRRRFEIVQGLNVSTHSIYLPIDVEFSLPCFVVGALTRIFARSKSFVRAYQGVTVGLNPQRRFFMAATCCVAIRRTHMLSLILAERWNIVATMQQRKRNTKAARLDVRITAQAKDKIEQAAVVSHQTVTDFVLTSLVRASEEALQRHDTIRLTNRDRDLFLAALDAEARPNSALRKAAEKFKRQYR